MINTQRKFPGTNRWKEGEEVLLTREPAAMQITSISRYIQDVVQGPWPEAEPFILESVIPNHIINYAKVAHPHGWPEGEKRLLEIGRPTDIATYAAAILGGPWPDGEKAMLKAFSDPRLLLYELATIATRITEYLRFTDRGRWPEFEKLLLKRVYEKAGMPAAGKGIHAGNPLLMKLYDYAIHVIKGRWPEAEPILEKVSRLKKMYDQMIDSLESRPRSD